MGCSHCSFRSSSIWLSKWLLPAAPSMSSCGPGKESELCRVFDRDNDIKGRRGRESHGKWSDEHTHARADTCTHMDTHAWQQTSAREGAR